MKVDGVTYCNICRAEIPKEDPDNEFITNLLDQAGHCHSEHLAQRNAIIDQYDGLVHALGAMLSPGVESAQKIAHASQMESRKGRSLRRLPSSPYVSVPKPPRGLMAPAPAAFREKKKGRRA